MRGPWSVGVCTHWVGAESRYCRSVDGVRAYLTGPRCPAHTPAALAGKPEAPSTTSLPASAFAPSPLSASHVADARAIASGKRRSSPHVYKAARAAADHRKGTP